MWADRDVACKNTKGYRMKKIDNPDLTDKWTPTSSVFGLYVGMQFPNACGTNTFISIARV